VSVRKLENEVNTIANRLILLALIGLAAIHGPKLIDGGLRFARLWLMQDEYVEWLQEQNEEQDILITELTNYICAQKVQIWRLKHPTGREI
jgi:hypothetical protein